ncbi:hypothetical protein [Myroides odoratus]|uniref:hypothetical protein n=1 Tax=Myroides odoratus TaxID=256 RepID=UPI0039AF844A
MGKHIQESKLKTIGGESLVGTSDLDVLKVDGKTISKNEKGQLKLGNEKGEIVTKSLIIKGESSVDPQMIIEPKSLTVKPINNAIERDKNGKLHSTNWKGVRNQLLDSDDLKQFCKMIFRYSRFEIRGDSSSNQLNTSGSKTFSKNISLLGGLDVEMLNVLLNGMSFTSYSSTAKDLVNPTAVNMVIYLQVGSTKLPLFNITKKEFSYNMYDMLSFNTMLPITFSDSRPNSTNPFYSQSEYMYTTIVDDISSVTHFVGWIRVDDELAHISQITSMQLGIDFTVTFEDSDNAQGKNRGVGPLLRLFGFSAFN